MRDAMFAVLVRKEILNNLLDLRFALAYFLCTLLIVGSGARMLAGYLAEKSTYDVNNAVYLRQWHEVTTMWEGGKNKVARRPLPTAILVQGGEKDPDRTANPAGKVSPHFYGDWRRDPLANLFPTLDMLFVVGVILSLVIMLLTYDTVAAERQGGTLRLLLSCPLSRVTVILAKWAGGLVSLLIPFVTAMLVVVIILLFTPGVGLTADDTLRVAALCALCGLYMSVVFSLAMMVSVMVRQPGLAILVLLLVWVVSIVAIPSLATPLSYVWHDPP
ncbi:MAG: ABC transporter permease subunit, partial [Chitinivibrionales bacterium]|nr:ABC transporter permease subunit [Chitinivibrionales bacterium]